MINKLIQLLLIWVIYHCLAQLIGFVGGDLHGKVTSKCEATDLAHTLMIL